ncbi:MAG: deoxyribodipyrimidine photo-lyase, partial [Alphaproteobacteria bacterium]|nr:deoxyribodipyrimidine photo-lyase [Alphaproteobacteria bacterium]
HGLDAVYWNHAITVQGKAHYTTLAKQLDQVGVKHQQFNGHLLCNPDQIRTSTGSVAKVFTPFWRNCLQNMVIPAPMVISVKDRMVPLVSDDLEDWSLLPKHPNWAKEFDQHWEPGVVGARKKLEDFAAGGLSHYAIKRNDLGKDGVSSLSPHIHFGELSLWQIYRRVGQETGADPEGVRVFVSQLGWREFSYYLLHHFPHFPHQNFKEGMDFPWKNDETMIMAWKNGQTGFPIIDAGMRQLLRTGTMNNRARLIVASFLTKNLMTDWRVGAAWFMDTLLDADEANNSAGWQWVAGCGADAAPYFRIFNPILQGEKFDPDGAYVKRWVPELANIPARLIHDPEKIRGYTGKLCGGHYSAPIVDLGATRDAALKAYTALKE